ncbi:MAG TPA: hypothetical protein VJ032_10560 [Thermoanaerobaculia bacterium]|nr:hypothetical protein [Thermoanaerobaculia bacterium]
MRRFSLVLVSALFVVFVSCKRNEQPAPADTRGNATDRAADGTSGTGQPASVANDSAASATALATAPPTGTGGPTGFTAPAPIAVTGTTVVRGAQTQTTGTLVGPNTTTVTVATPTDTTSTIKTPAGTTTQKH